MRTTIYIGYLLAGVLCCSVSFGQVQRELIVGGSKDDALRLITLAMKEEYPDGNISPPMRNPIGHRVVFKTMFSGEQFVDSILLTPLISETGESISAHRIGFRASKSDYSKDLADRVVIVAKSGAMAGVKVLPDASGLFDPDTRRQKCNEKIENDPDLAPIAGKVSLVSTEKQTFEMRANSAVPSESERQTISLWAKKRAHCSSFLTQAVEYNPNDPYFPILRAALLNLEKLILDLYKGTLTYGKFAEYRLELLEQYRAAHDKVRLALEEKNAAARERARMIAIEAEKASAARSQARSQEIQAQAAKTAAEAAADPMLKLISPRSLNCNSISLGGGLLSTECN